MHVSISYYAAIFSVHILFVFFILLCFRFYYNDFCRFFFVFQTFWRNLKVNLLLLAAGAERTCPTPPSRVREEHKKEKPQKVSMSSDGNVRFATGRKIVGKQSDSGNKNRQEEDKVMQVIW